jgi:hypothetical protein
MSARKPLRNGKPASPNGGPQSQKPKMPSKDLRKLLTTVYNQLQRLDDSAANAVARQDFVFHMTDWLDDLDRLKMILDHPDQVDRRKAASEIAGILYHIIPHLKAAGRLLLDNIPDAFEQPVTRL